jgi:hypothetical protein
MVQITKAGFKKEAGCFDVSGKYFDRIRALEKAQGLTGK